MNGELRVASLNMLYGGLAGDDDSRWRTMMEHLVVRDLDVVLLQEMTTPSVAGLHDHLWRTGNELGMIPVLGPAMPHTTGRTYPAILVRMTGGLQTVSTGPPLWSSGGGAFPSWCQARVQAAGMPHPVAFYSVHLPSCSAQVQLGQAQQLASVIAQRGEIAIAGGDWNCLARGDQVSQADLEAMPPHLRPARMRALPGADGSIVLEPNYDVHDTLTGVGLTDVAAWLPPGRREPGALSSTARHGRIDRFYVTEGLPPAVLRYAQADTGASDHLALMIVIDIRGAAAITPRGAVA